MAQDDALYNPRFYSFIKYVVFSSNRAPHILRLQYDIRII